jgi:hypothetical protein
MKRLRPTDSPHRQPSTPREQADDRDDYVSAYVSAVTRLPARQGCAEGAALGGIDRDHDWLADLVLLKRMGLHPQREPDDGATSYSLRLPGKTWLVTLASAEEP